MELKFPRLRSVPFESQIIERYKRRESSVEEALVEMYLTGVSVRRVEGITKAFEATRVSPSTCERAESEDLRPHRRVAKSADRRQLGVSLPGGGEDLGVVGSGVDEEGYREILGVCEGLKEDKESWRSFLRHLKERGLAGVSLYIHDLINRHPKRLHSDCFPCHLGISYPPQ